MPENPYFVGLQLLLENQQIEDIISISRDTPFRVSGIVMEGHKPFVNALVTVTIADTPVNVTASSSGRFTAAFNNTRVKLPVGGPYSVAIECEGVQQKGQLQVTIVNCEAQQVLWSDERTKEDDNRYSETIRQRKSFFARLLGQGGPPLETVVATQQIITVWGTQGGVGTTSTSILLGRLIHEEGFRVLILEISPTGGSLLRFLGKSPSQAGLDTVVLRNSEEIYRLEERQIPIVTGLNVLPTSGSKVDVSGTWDEETGRKLFEWARRQAAFVIVDAGAYREPMLARLALQQANWIVALSRGTASGVDAAVRFDTWRMAVGWNKVIWCLSQSESSLKHQFTYETGLRVSAELMNRRKEYYALERGGSPQDGIRKDIYPLIKQLLAAPKAKVF
ncbi:hypothetical protein Desaci_4097 [Desulfosporosinus acidiphilus SJ4]|uniref:CobQ/CobB/MinD/ParA nucleotide binding domain-containing protein n=1 Tax=Desulfosporosinus acidiphilus (strain DSM 22704 / JCM 16185 / SJ4) TaxID=646529 RepID=I4DAY6_DESAJ|nr:hypothetical protein [Desulfosporosinus acidiphilus]AFM42960.1 hypothetical protein Desaci_4097 [Desulfosporosinus acidiphilus SJ4]